ncbi:MAG: hypothetical protein KBC73_01190 [Burkholderiaceae bacterium]|nr:hypothetical protein [Burkholderiaceae bacterium]
MTTELLRSYPRLPAAQQAQLRQAARLEAERLRQAALDQAWQWLRTRLAALGQRLRHRPSLQHLEA